MWFVNTSKIFNLVKLDTIIGTGVRTQKMAHLDYGAQSASCEQTQDKIKHIIEPNQSMDDVMGAYKHWAKTFEAVITRQNTCYYFIIKK